MCKSWFLMLLRPFRAWINSMEHVAQTAEAMAALGRSCGKSARAGSVFALVGDLGAGKTHWTQGFLSGIGSSVQATSPTFGLVHEYPGGRLPVFHFDFHRVTGPQEILALGWDEYLDSGGIVVAEWADRFPELFPSHTCWLEIILTENGSRIVRPLAKNQSPWMI
jgi:tRNA threonylcarbamoyladenosine biosynthesis protein TsaE